MEENQNVLEDSVVENVNVNTTIANAEVSKDLITNSDSVIRGNCFRISILTERLIRLEYHPNGIFNDYESTLVKFRNFSKPSFDKQEDARFLVIKTKYFTLSYTKEKPFDAGKLMPMANLKVDLNDTDRSWYYNHPEVKNYKGNFIAVDGSEEDSKPRNGLYSLDGFASLDDSNNYIFDADGKMYQRDGNGIDIYLFMYKDDFDLALKDYFTLTGYPAMIPRYALGNWWSRDLNYTTDELKEVVNNFEKSEIPLSVLLLDKGWHIDNSEENKEVKTGYTFNKDLIPDAKELINELHNKNIKIGLNLNMADGIYPSEENYAKIAGMFNITDNKIIAFDPLNPTLLDAIYQLMISPLTKLGVDFYWNDINSNTLPADKLFLINKSMFENKEINGQGHNMILARNGLIATHRYPITYTGKTIVGWEGLRKAIKHQAMAANIGVSWISSDVNGNYGGVEEEELYVRAIEQAVFGPIVRFNAPRGRYYRKEPWRWNAKTLEIVSRFLKLRHRLVPYLYTLAYRYHEKGSLVIRPLTYKYPWVYDDSTYKYEYLLGRDILVSPIITKKDTLINRTIHRVFIPDGVWYDFMTGKKFPGNKQYISFYRDEDYPIFIKRGGIIPLVNDKDVLNGVDNPKSFEIHIFPGESNVFDMYEDNPKDPSKYLITQIDYNYLPSNYTVIIRNLEGDNKDVVDAKRNYKIRFRNTKKADDVICYFNDSQIKTIGYVDDSDFVVEINDVPSIGQITLNCKGKDIEIDAMRFINDDIDSILLDLPVNTVLKEQISSIMFSDLPLKRKRIEIRKLRKYNLGREYIKLFLKLLEYIGTI